MKKIIYVLTVLFVIILGTTAIAANTGKFKPDVMKDTIESVSSVVVNTVDSKSEGIKNAIETVSSWFDTEKGEIFLLDVGETEEIVIHPGSMTVELLGIEINPEDVSDVKVDGIVFSNTNPQPDEIVHMIISVTNIGSGTAHAVSFSIDYGDGVHALEAIMVQLLPGETVKLEYDHAYQEVGTYIVIANARANNDVNPSNNYVCERIDLGDTHATQHPETECAIGMPGPVIPKDAHILYTVYRPNGQIEHQEELWINQYDIGYPVEVLKLSDTQALVTVPM